MSSESQPSTTSEHEIVEKSFEGLNIKNEYGHISLPEDAVSANLSEEVVDLSLAGFANERIFINKPVLSEYLLEVNGAHIFRAVGDRFLVLAKVRNIHLPFYISSTGTGGKNAGQWYPFFGYTGSWLIKGYVDDDGAMTYHPEISKVQEILNKNLVFPQQLVSNHGKIGREYDRRTNEPQQVIFDLNEHLVYQNCDFTNYADKDREFVNRITGYVPETIRNDGSGASNNWINEVTRNIK